MERIIPLIWASFGWCAAMAMNTSWEVATAWVAAALMTFIFGAITKIHRRP